MRGGQARAMKSLFLSIIFLFIWSSTVQAKVGDPTPLVKNGVAFSIHGNTLEAVRVSDSTRLWKVVFPVNPDESVKDPRLERDVQWDRVVELSVSETGNLLVRFRSGRVFAVDMKTGEYCEQRPDQQVTHQSCHGVLPGGSYERPLIENDPPQRAKKLSGGKIVVLPD
jgi:hypothetical protein